MNLLERSVGRQRLVRVLGTLVGVMLIVGITALPAAATHTVGAPTPNNAPVGCEVTIPGTGFTDISAVTIDGIAATFQVISTTQIAAVVPVGASGSNVATVVTKTTPSTHTDTDNAFDVGGGTCPVTVTGFSPTTG